jgi:hypothetical protein
VCGAILDVLLRRGKTTIVLQEGGFRARARPGNQPKSKPSAIRIVLLIDIIEYNDLNHLLD